MFYYEDGSFGNYVKSTHSEGESHLGGNRA